MPGSSSKAPSVAPPGPDMAGTDAWLLAEASRLGLCIYPAAYAAYGPHPGGAHAAWAPPTPGAPGAWPLPYAMAAPGCGAYVGPHLGAQPPPPARRGL